MQRHKLIVSLHNQRKISYTNEITIFGLFFIHKNIIKWVVKQTDQIGEKAILD